MLPGAEQLSFLLQPPLELVRDLVDTRPRRVDEAYPPAGVVRAPFAPARPVHARVAVLLDHERPEPGIAGMAAHPFAPVHEVVEVVAEPRRPVVTATAHAREPLRVLAVEQARGDRIELRRRRRGE